MTQYDGMEATDPPLATAGGSASIGPNPVKKIRDRKLRCRIISGNKAKKPVSVEPFVADVKDWIKQYQSLDHCMIVKSYKGREKKCTCNKDIPVGDDDFDKLSRFLHLKSAN